MEPKTPPKLVEKLFFFLSLLFLVPRRSFGGFEEPSALFSGYFPDLGAQNLWFFHRKILLSQEAPFSLLGAPEALLGASRLLLGPSWAKMEPQREAQNSSKVILEVVPKWTPKLITFWTNFELILVSQN